MGIEPITCRLQGDCSADWATSARAPLLLSRAIIPNAHRNGKIYPEFFRTYSVGVYQDSKGKSSKNPPLSILTFSEVSNPTPILTFPRGVKEEILPSGGDVRRTEGGIPTNRGHTLNHSKEIQTSRFREHFSVTNRAWKKELKHQKILQMIKDFFLCKRMFEEK